MKIRLLILFGLVAAVYSNPLAAAPTIVGTYYEDRGVCSGNTSGYGCSLYFGLTPANKYLLVTNMSCWARSGSVNVLSRIQLFASASNTSGSTILRSTFLDLGTYSRMANFYFYQINQPVKFMVGPGRYPGIRLDAISSGDTLAECVLAGELIPL